MSRTLPELIEQLTTRAACPSDITEALTEIDRRLTALEGPKQVAESDALDDALRALARVIAMSSDAGDEQGALSLMPALDVLTLRRRDRLAARGVSR